MTPAEADQFIIKARQALASHRRDAVRSNGEGRLEFESAVTAILGNLRDLAAEQPDKAEKIGALVSRYQQ